MREFFAGRMSPSWVLRHVERLLHEPWSHYRAELMERSAAAADDGKPSDPMTLPFLGWGRAEVQRAELLSVQTGEGFKPWEPADEVTSRPVAARSWSEAMAFLTPPSR